MSNTTKEWEKEKQETLKKFEKNKKLFDDYHNKKASWKDLKVFFTEWELATLKNNNKLKQYKSPEQIKQETEQEKELELMRKLDSKLSLADKKIRKEIRNFLSGVSAYKIWGYSVKELEKRAKEIKKIPEGKIKRVLTNKELNSLKEDIKMFL